MYEWALLFEMPVTVAIVAGAHKTSHLCSAADFSSLVVFSYVMVVSWLSSQQAGIPHRIQLEIEVKQRFYLIVYCNMFRSSSARCLAATK